MPHTSLPPGLVFQKLLFRAARAKAEPGASCSLSPFTSTVLSSAWEEEEEGSLLCWDHQLGTGTVPGCAALASWVSLLQGMGTLSMGISRMKVIPWCHIPVQLQPWLVQQCYSGGLYHCQGNVQHPLDLTWSHRSYHQQWHSLSFQVTTFTWMRMVSRAAFLPSWLSFPSATDLGETRAICAGARKSLRGSLLAWLSPWGPHCHRQPWQP